jgi:hypothetical protein
MADEPRPWWFSGGEEPDEGPGDEGTEPSSETGADQESVPIDWTTLVSGAMRMMDWATGAVMAPHAEHDDPTEHPQCVVCRGILLMGRQETVPEAAAPDEQRHAAATSITWIPISDE